MTEAEKLAQRLTAETLMCSGVMVRRIQSQDDIEAAALIRSQEVKIKRMAGALRDAYNLHGLIGQTTLSERHADALRIARGRA